MREFADQKALQNYVKLHDLVYLWEGTRFDRGQPRLCSRATASTPSISAISWNAASGWGTTRSASRSTITSHLVPRQKVFLSFQPDHGRA
jgi:hypothetical protein